MGSLLQLSFKAISTIAIIPLMCHSVQRTRNSRNTDMIRIRSATPTRLGNRNAEIYGYSGIMQKKWKLLYVGVILLYYRAI